MVVMISELERTVTLIFSACYFVYFCFWVALPRLRSLFAEPPFGVPAMGREKFWVLQSYLLHVGILFICLLFAVSAVDGYSRGLIHPIWVSILISFSGVASGLCILGAIGLSLWLVNTAHDYPGNYSMEGENQSGERFKSPAPSGALRAEASRIQTHSSSGGPGSYTSNSGDSVGNLRWREGSISSAVEAGAVSTYRSGLRETAVHYRRIALLSVASVCLTLGLVCCAVVAYRFAYPGLVNLDLMWPLVVILAAFFLWVAGVIAAQVFGRVPAICVEETGITLSPLPGMRTSLAWEQILGAHVSSKPLGLYFDLRDVQEIEEAGVRWIQNALPPEAGLGVGGKILGPELGAAVGVVQTYAEQYGFPGPLDRQLGRVVAPRGAEIKTRSAEDL